VLRRVLEEGERRLSFP